MAETHLDAAASRYRDAVVQALGEHVDVLASFVLGSGLAGGYRPGESDLDLVVVVDRPLAGDGRRRAIERIGALPLPARKLELVVYVRGHQPPDFDLNLEVGRGGSHEAPGADPHWFVVDAALAQDRAPGWGEWFERIPPERVRAAVGESLEWSQRRPGDEFARVNAIRARHYIEHGEWISKEEAR